MDSVRTRLQVRELDRRTVEEYDYPSILLMENAGRACADVAMRMQARGGGATLIVCGPGNNGGDGLVVARTLHNRGLQVGALLVGDPSKFDEGSGDVRTNLAWAKQVGVRVGRVESTARLREWDALIQNAGLVVDALFGTGLTRPVEGLYADVIDVLTKISAPILAVDIPSGLDADTGEVLGAAACAAATVTLAAPKPGLEIGQGPELCGRVIVAEIGIPRPLFEAGSQG